jgi:hypothetical protein
MSIGRQGLKPLIYRALNVTAGAVTYKDSFYRNFLNTYKIILCFSTLATVAADFCARDGDSDAAIVFDLFF